MVVRRLGGAGRALFTLPNIRRRATNSWAAVRDTFFSTKQVFENHRIVFTVGTSVASVLTAWAGYSLRHVQQSRFERRLESIESSLKDNHKVEHEEIKKIVTSSNISTPACVATAMTTMVVGRATLRHRDQGCSMHSVSMSLSFPRMQQPLAVNPSSANYSLPRMNSRDKCPFGFPKAD